MSKKFIQNIQKLIEEKDPKKDLGLVSEGNISHFQAKPPALISNPIPITDPSGELPAGGPPTPKNQNFIWNKESFNHNKGAFKDLIFEDFITTIKKSRNTITSINGDLSDYIVGNNKNIKYTVQVNVSTPVTVTITPFVNNSISLAVYTAPGFSSAIKVFTSGSERYVPSNINLNLNKIGLWTITILLYQEKGDTAFNILDQLGSFVEAASESISINDQKLITFDTTKGNNGIESIFIDGAFGPSLSNVIYWNKLDNFTEGFGGGELTGYGLYTVVNERLSNDVVSGWGTDAFVVSGSKLPLFPIASTLGISGPASTAYKVSGTEFDTGANRTIVTVSGTAFSGVKFDPIYIERTIHLTDILQDDTLGSVVSGTHFNVKAGDQYTYEVDTFNSFGNRGPRSTRISGTAGDIISPNPVTNFVVSGGTNLAYLNWTNPNDNDLKGVNIWDQQNPNRTIIFHAGFENGSEEGFTVTSLPGPNLAAAREEQFFTGGWSFKVIPGGSPGGSNDPDDWSGGIKTFNITANKKYHIKAHVYAQNTPPEKARVNISNDLVFLQNKKSPTKENEWEILDFGISELVDTTGTATISLEGLLVGEIFFDDVIVSEVIEPNIIFPIETLTKSKSEFFDRGNAVNIILNKDNSGTLVPGSYNLYASTFDWSGNENLIEMPSGTATITNVSSTFKGPNPWIDVTHPTYGAIGDGIADDTNAIQSAINDIPENGGTIFFPRGTYRFTSQLVFGESGTQIRGVGFNAADTSTAGTVLLKNGDFDGVVISGTFTSMEDIDVKGDSGNTGMGIILKIGAHLTRVSSRFHGGVGIRIGWDSAHNVNHWRLDNVAATNNGESGIYVHDEDAGPDANTGLATLINCKDNGGDGLRIGNVLDNQFFMVHTLSNAGYGVNLAGGSNSNSIWKLYSEADVSGTMNFAGGSRNLLWGLNNIIGDDDIKGLVGTSNDNMVLGRAADGGYRSRGDFDWFVDGVISGTSFFVRDTVVLNQGTPANNLIGGNLNFDRTDAASSCGTGNNFDFLIFANNLTQLVINAAGGIRSAGAIEIDGDLNHDGSNVGFYGTAPVAQQTGVAVTAAGIHAALVNLGLITA